MTMPIGKTTNSALNTLFPQGIGAIAGGSGYSMQSEELGRGMNIRIVPANGGTIISIRDESSFSGSSDLYVVGQDQDIAAELSKIITLHYLKK
jgi:hypothetical protein